MLEEKVEALTKEIVALRQAIEKGGTAAGTKAAEKAKPAAKGKAKAAADDDDDDDDDDDEPKAKAKGKPAAKAKAKAPKHDEDEVGAIFRKAAKKDKPACKKYLKKVECEDLAELLTDESKFDAAYAFAESVLEADDDDDDDDDDD